MATPRRLGAFAALAVTIVSLLAFPGARDALADPRQSPRAVQAELDRLNREVDNAVEDYDAARIDLAAAQRKVAAVQARIRRADADLAVLQRHMGGLAAAAYRTGGSDEFVTLVTTSSPQTFLDQATTLDQIARNQAGEVRAVRAARRRLKSEQDAAREALKAQRAIERRLRDVKRSIEGKVARTERLLSLIENRARRDAAWARLRASRNRRPRIAYTGSAAGRARVAVAEAYRQLGKPYRYGAAGPGSFDCSGLTMWSWARAGVSLPHSSRAQYGYGTHVSYGDLRPGDLVFFGHPIHHVGMYVGGGQYIAAPHSGDVVSFRPMNRGDYAGAVRL